MVSPGMEDCPGEPFRGGWEPRPLEGAVPEAAGRQGCVCCSPTAEGWRRRWSAEPSASEMVGQESGWKLRSGGEKVEAVSSGCERDER